MTDNDVVLRLEPRLAVSLDTVLRRHEPFGTPSADVGGVDTCPFDIDNDVEGDGVCGDVDNCPSDNNPLQEDSDSNGIGDACQASPTCSDGIDNDGDGYIDHPDDTGWTDASDDTETDPALPCDDGIDNDGDGLIDWDGNFGLTGADPECNGFGFAPSEAVPEPGSQLGLAVGTLVLALLPRKFARRECARRPRRASSREF